MMINDVKVIKLVSGEEVIARVTKRTEDSITLYHPLMYRAIVTKRGENWSGTLIPWLKTSHDKEMKILKQIDI